MKKDISNISNNEIIFPKKSIYFISFLEGFLVMVTQLIAVGLISPHYGQGLTVYTFVLGLTMLSLAIGYYFGSYLADNEDQFRKVLLLLVLYCVALLLMPYISKAMYRSSTNLSLLESLSLSLPLFMFFPLIVLGALSPILVGLLAKDENVGVSASKIFVYSTFGGVVSSIITGFFFFELFEIEQLVIFLYCLLFLLILYLTFNFKLKKLRSVILFVLFFGLFFYIVTNKKHFNDPLPNSYSIIYKNDGILGQVKIIDNLKEKTRSLYTNNTIQTFSMINGQNVWEYIQRIGQYVNFKRGNILLAGLGGGILVKVLVEKQKSIDIVDIDKRMVDISENYYNIGNEENVRFYVDDIRHYLRVCKKKYNTIVLDLSASENVPSHVFTLEALEELKTKLEFNGNLIIHYFSDFKLSGQKSIDAIGHTLQRAGYTVKFIPTEKKKNELSSIVYVAFKDRKSFNDPENKHLIPASFKQDILLTDDKPLLDVLRKEMVHFTREEYIKSYKSNWETIRSLGIN